MTVRTNNDGGMGVMFLTTEELGRHIWRYLDSREWWAIPWVSEQSVWLCQQIEARYYPGAANADFVRMTCPPESGATAIAFARKERLPAADLLALMHSRESSELPPDDLKDRDVILATDSENPEAETMTIALVHIWLSWLMRVREAA